MRLSAAVVIVIPVMGKTDKLCPSGTTRVNFLTNFSNSFCYLDHSVMRDPGWGPVLVRSEYLVPYVLLGFRRPILLPE